MHRKEEDEKEEKNSQLVLINEGEKDAVFAKMKASQCWVMSVSKMNMMI